MNKKHEDLIIKIVRIKINIIFTIIFMTALSYSAEILREVTYTKEKFFWIAVILIMMFQALKNITTVFNIIEDWINNKDAKGRQDE